jgi:beta-glucosidase
MMIDGRVSRRSVLMGGAAIAAWSASPVSAMLRRIDPGKDAATIDALIAQMTLEEKAGQLNLLASAWGGGIATALNPPGGNSDFPKQVADAIAGKLTGVFNGNGAAMAMQMQRAVMSGSRLKIPLMFAADIIHGHRTIFPVPVAEAASFEPELAMRTGRHRPRPALGPDDGGRRRGCRAGLPVRRRAGSRVSGKFACRRRRDAVVRQAFRRLWRGRGGARL